MSKYFQLTILLVAILYTALFFTPYAWQWMYSDEIINVLAASGSGGIFELNSPFPYLYSGLYIISLVGLYSYRKAAKWLYTAIIGFNLFISPYILGFSVAIYFDATIAYLLTLLEGGLLVMLYSKDVSDEFKRL